MARNNHVYEARFTNERTGEVRVYTFTLQEYIQTRQWMAYPNPAEPASILVLWLQESNLNRQSAYCAVKHWKDEANAKGAP